MFDTTMRFRETLNALRDCWDHFSDYVSDEDEHLARRKLAELCRDIAAKWDWD